MCSKNGQFLDFHIISLDFHVLSWIFMHSHKTLSVCFVQLNLILTTINFTCEIKCESILGFYLIFYHTTRNVEYPESGYIPKILALLMFGLYPECTKRIKIYCIRIFTQTEAICTQEIQLFWWCHL